MWAAGILALGVLITLASPAGADPIGPSDYGSEIVAIDPPAPGARFDILGGDAFLALALEEGHVAEVRGYADEPYLRFEADGRVLENRNSPAYHLNTSRYGADHDHDAKPEDPPRWVVVATNGAYAWHDHRIHYMGNVAPTGSRPGSVILESSVPLTVDGQGVEVSIRSRWLRAPSPFPALVGAGAALGLLIVGRHVWRLRVGALAAAAGVVAAITVNQVIGAPSGTGGTLSLWAVPCAAFTALGAAVVWSRGQVEGRASSGAALAGAALSLLWCVMNRRSVTAAITGLSAPGWLTRLVTAMLAVLAIATVIAEARKLWTVPQHADGVEDGPPAPSEDRTEDPASAP